MKNKTQKKLHTIVTSSWIGGFVRLGYFIRGILYGSIGIVTLQMLFGFRSHAKNTSDVLYAIHKLLFGNYLLVITIAGLIGYAIWSLIRATLDLIDTRSPRISTVSRIAYIFSACSYLVLIIPTSALILIPQFTQKSSSINQVLFYLITIPNGSIALMVIGIAVILGGIAQTVKAIRSKRPSDFWSEEDLENFRLPFLILAKIGISVRGIVFALIGFFIIQAGIYLNPSDIKSVDGIIETTQGIRGGYLLLAAIGIGLTFFGMYSASLSIFVNLPERNNLET